MPPETHGRPRRSELATPGSSPERMFEKAATSGADLVFLDLEDACAPDERAPSRPRVVAALTSLDWGSTIRAVRVNGIDTEWCHDDLIEVVVGAGSALDVIILPKVRRARDVWWADVLLSQLESKLRLSRRIGLEVLIEEAEGLGNVEEIARASSRLEAIIFGAGDYSASIRARVDTNFQPISPYPGDFWHYARCRIVAAARAAGVGAIDAPYPAYHDSDGYRRDAVCASLLGFDGKWAIHPSQVPIANAVFAPTAEEVAWALQTQEKYGVGVSEGRGAIGVDGLLVDAAHMRHVQNVLARVGVPRSEHAAARLVAEQHEVT